MTHGRRLLIVGWDGATPELVEPWVEQGHLPNLAALMGRGAYGRLRSVIHPLSPQAWASCVTGLNPGRHGLYDFGRRLPGTYQVELVTSRDRSGVPLWSRVGEAGGASVVVNVPITWPPEAVRGAMVTGMHTPSLARGLWPPDLWEQVRRAVPDYRIDAMSFDYESRDAFLADLAAGIDGRMRMFGYLWEWFRPDLGFLVFTETDRVQHSLWKQSCLPGEGQERATWRYAHAIRDVYQRLDSALGDLRAMVGDDCAVVVLSDHGFGSLDRDVYLNAVLEDMGLLAVRRPAPTGALSRLARRLPGPLRPSPWKGAAEAALDGTPRPAFGDVDWERTRAYASGLFGGIHLNLRGREPSGTVPPGPEAEAVLSRVERALLELRDPDDGQPIVDRVHRREALYRGPRAAEAPDLLVVMRGYRYMTRSGREIGRPGELVVPPAVDHSGNHRLDGILAMAGPGISPGVRLEQPHILDVAPTALALMGLPVPLDLDGRPLERAFPGLGWRYAAPGELSPSDGGARPAPEALLDRERDAMVRRLEGLGYLA
ncbi:alkaline phosphatase family protein [Myxococcota bacterium]|nr:alkaline phosphatase family protein [Myxococcota bacterium]